MMTKFPFLFIINYLFIQNISAVLPGQKSTA